jgi:hypothetical protein
VTYTEHYCGPRIDARRKDLAGLEQKRCYIAERKKDGYWGILKIKEGRNGQHRLESRTGLLIDNTGLEKADLGPLTRNTHLVGEPEIGTEAAKRRNRGYIPMWLHELPLCKGHDLRQQPTSMRQELLREAVHPLIPQESVHLFPLVEQARHHFERFYDEALADGDEGVVLKDLNSPYRTRSNGKNDHWIRVKPERHIDFVILGVERTASNDWTVTLGYIKNGKLQRMQAYQLRDVRVIEGMPYQEEKNGDLIPAIGLVIEMCGWEVHESGALRGAQPVCWRPDKTAEMCTGIVEYRP